MSYDEQRDWTVGDEMRLARQIRRLTQTDLARQIGTTQPTISRVEHDVFLPCQRLRERLAEVLGIPESFFEEGD